MGTAVQKQHICANCLAGAVFAPSVGAMQYNLIRSHALQPSIIFVEPLCLEDGHNGRGKEGFQMFFFWAICPSCPGGSKSTTGSLPSLPVRLHIVLTTSFCVLINITCGNGDGPLKTSNWKNQSCINVESDSSKTGDT